MSDNTISGNDPPRLVPAPAAAPAPSLPKPPPPSEPPDLFEKLQAGITTGLSKLGGLKDKYLERPFANGRDGFVAVTPDGSVVAGLPPGARIRDRDLPDLGDAVDRGAEFLASGEQRKVSFTLPDGRVIDTQTDDRGDFGLQNSDLTGLSRGVDPKRGGTLSLGISTPNGEPANARVLMLPVGYDGPIFVCDIDDTLRETNEADLLMGRRQEALKGSREALEAAAKLGIPIIYLSVGSNQIRRANLDFLSQLPPGVLLDRDRFTLKDLDLRNKAQARNQAFFKQQVLGALREAFPQAKLFGYGDDKYGDALAYTRQGLEAYIRDVRPGNDNVPPDFTGSMVKDHDPAFIAKVTADLQQAVQQSASFGGVPVPSDRYEALSRKLDRVTGSRPSTGNTIQLHVDGPNAFPRILAGIDSAKRSLCYETYELRDDAVGNQVADHLIAAAKRGVKVRVIADAAGSRHLPLMPNRVMERMRAAGVDARVYSPIDSLTDVIHYSRDHRKTILVDGEKAFVGGMNTGVNYMGQPEGNPNWEHDLFSELEGPAVKGVADAFADSWKAAGGEAIPSAELQGNQSARADGVKLRVVTHTPGQEANIHAAYLSMINAAQHHVNVENCFPLTNDLADALCAAAQRGVDVRYIVPNSENLIALVTKKHYQRLIDAGANLYVYPGPLHSKALSVDGKVATIGSSNFDSASLERNREIIALVEDPDWVRDFEKRVFEQDMVGKPTGEKTQKLTRVDDGVLERLRDGLLDRIWPDFLE